MAQTNPGSQGFSRLIRWGYVHRLLIQGYVPGWIRFVRQDWVVGLVQRKRNQRSRSVRGSIYVLLFTHVSTRTLCTDRQSADAAGRDGMRAEPYFLDLRFLSAAAPAA